MEKQNANNRDWSLINCIATSLLAYFFTIPFHEFLHFVTFYIYGHKVLYFSAGSVEPIFLYDIYDLSLFHRIMVAGGSASIINAIVGILLLIILIKAQNMPPMLRVFLTQLMGGQFLEGFGYFLIGGLFQAGDWGTVFTYFDAAGVVTAMRIILGVVGAIASFLILYIATYITYDFIQDPSDKNERKRVSVRLNLTLFLSGIIVGTLVSINLPEVKNGVLPLWMFLLFNIMWFIYLVAFFYVWGGIMVKPPRESRLKCSLPKDPHPVIWAIAVILILIDIFLFGPGLYL